MDLTKMNPEVKALWVPALRSGDYPQAKGALIERRRAVEGSVTGYCCLGVLCDIAVKQGVDGIRLIDTDTDLRFEFRDDDLHGWSETEGTLPWPVQVWSGLDDDPYITDERSSAIEVNDNLEWDFKRIARAIEENL